MGILLFLLGLLGAGSGATKLRGYRRTCVGIPRLALSEVVAGALLILGSGIGLARLRAVAWPAVAVTAVVVIVSSALHWRAWRRAWRRRRESEELRLKQFLEVPWW
jgi:hypothetical protein